MSEKLTVAELLARNAKEGGRASSERPRRRRSIDVGGVAVSDLTGSFPVVRIDDDGAAASGDGAEDAASGAQVHNAHEAKTIDPIAQEAEATEVAESVETAAATVTTATTVVPADTEPESADIRRNSAPPVQTTDTRGAAAIIIPDSLLEPVPAAAPLQTEVAREAQVAEASPAPDSAGSAEVAEVAVAAETVESAQEPAVVPEITEMAEETPDAESVDLEDVSDVAEVAVGAVRAERSEALETTEDVQDTAVTEVTEAADSAEAAEAANTVEAVEVTDAVEVGESTVGADSTVAIPAEASAPAKLSNKVLEYEDDTISWPALVFQSALAVVVGVLIFFGFTLVWDNLNNFLALALALVVSFVCVGVVHALLRHRDTLLLVLTFIVGIALTVGPRLIMSI